MEAGEILGAAATTAQPLRRSLGRRTLIASALVAGGGVALAACSPTTSAPPRPLPAAANLPVHTPYAGVIPDLPGTAEGVLPGFFAYPASPATYVSGTPGSGKPIRALLELGITPVPLAQNTYWQELNRRLGVELLLDGAPSSEYGAKLAAVVAGGTLPDVVQLQPQPRLGQLLDSRFVDLTPHLAGDAVKKYPALANLPQASWRSTVFGGKIFGVPYAQGAMSSVLLLRKDLFDARGLNVAPASAAEFAETCKQLTDPGKQRWALANATPPGILHFVQQMFGAPNTWRDSNGRFTSWYEGEETRQALDFVAGLWRDGVFHPESFTSSAKLSGWFTSGTIAMSYGSYSNWSNQYRNAKVASPDAELSAMAPPRSAGGGPAPRFTNSQMYTFTSISRGSADRVEELLAVMDWLAAPFGTEEYLFKKYGLAGQHHTLQGTDPILTDAGKAEIRLPIFYVANHAPMLYEPGLPDQTRAQHELQVAMVPGSIPPGNVGLQSEVEASKAARLDRMMRDIQADVIQGRQTLSAWDDAVATWRREGGDEIRADLEALRAKEATR